MKFDKATVSRWCDMAAIRLSGLGMSLEGIDTGSTAWLVASRSGILDEAYADRDVTDGHIQTALEKIFPNAVFLDKKVY